MSQRPELVNPPEIFYDNEEAHKYAQNSRMIKIQRQMSERAIELLALPPGKPCLILDIGCGSGLSGEVLSDLGHQWIGTDISPSMLGVAVEREVEGDMIQADMGQGLGFRAGCFDGCISISALQWLCNADHANHVPHRRLKVFFQSLYNCLSSGSRAVFQFYPASPAQMTMITEAAMKCGFSGGLVVDFPNSKKAKKYFLCLFAGESAQHDDFQVPVAKTAEHESGDMQDEMGDDDRNKAAAARGTVLFTASDRKYSRIKGKNRRHVPAKSRQWVLAKKDTLRRKGRDTANDSKYSARKRGPRF